MPEIIKVHGLEELARKLKALPARMTRNALRSGVNAGARLIRDAYRGSVNDDTGTLRRSIITKFIRERSNDQQAMYYVTARKGKKLQRLGKRNADAFYAGMVEFGHYTRPAGKHSVVTARIHGGRPGGPESTKFLTRSVFNQLPRGKGRALQLGIMAGRGEIKWVEGRRWLTRAFETKKLGALDAIKIKITSNLAKMAEFK